MRPRRRHESQPRRFRNGISTHRPSCSISTSSSRTSRRCAPAWPATEVGIRPHAKTHKSSDIAKLQLAAGAVGICTRQAQRSRGAVRRRRAEDSDDDRESVARSKIQRAMNIRKKNREFIQAVDYPQNARDLADAAKAAGITADVVVDVAVGTRSGVPAGDQALALAQLIDTLPNLKFRGMLAYDGGAQHIKGYKARHDQSLARYEGCHQDVRSDEGVGIEHRDLQRRRHRHVQHHDEGARLHRCAGRQLRLHGRAVSRDRQREAATSSPTSRRRSP